MPGWLFGGSSKKASRLIKNPPFPIENGHCLPEGLFGCFEPGCARPLGHPAGLFRGSSVEEPSSISHDLKDLPLIERALTQPSLMNAQCSVRTGSVTAAAASVRTPSDTPASVRAASVREASVTVADKCSAALEALKSVQKRSKAFKSVQKRSKALKSVTKAVTSAQMPSKSVQKRSLMISRSFRSKRLL